ncbi:MAG: VOC family protein [Marinoscillum sp.]|uniref:VOC family protein n=1 Tax=Marinoscillum sp. TaxID=2024838 RepID=UPI0032F1EC7D
MNLLLTKRILFVIILLATLEVNAQDYKPQVKTDHIAIVVADLPASAQFYSEILGLDEITNQTKKTNIRWFTLADGVELHLINRSKEGIQLIKDVHLALAVNDFEAFVNMLREKKVNFENWPGEANSTNSRPDGVRQVYIQDPDGYWIEINDAARF